MFKSILVAVDLADDATSAHLLKLARHLAAADGEITVFHVVQPLPTYVALQAPASVVEAHRKEAEARLKALGGDGVATITGVGNAGTEILDQAARIGADAIIVGSHKPGLVDYLIGSTAARVVRHATCTVVVDRAALKP